MFVPTRFRVPLALTLYALRDGRYLLQAYPLAAQVNLNSSPESAPKRVR